MNQYNKYLYCLDIFIRMFIPEANRMFLFLKHHGVFPAMFYGVMSLSQQRGGAAAQSNCTEVTCEQLYMSASVSLSVLYLLNCYVSLFAVTT